MSGHHAENREILRLQIEELWGKGRTELVDTLYTSDAIDHMPLPGQPSGVSGLRGVVESFHEALPDLQIKVHGILAEEDRAVDFWTLTGTHQGEVMGLKPTGNSVAFSGIDMVRIRDGRISDIWHVEELLQMLMQMGADPVSFGRPQRSSPPPSAEEDPR